MSNNKKSLTVNIPQHMQAGVFSNTAKVNVSQREVVIDFALLEPNVKGSAVLVSRVILTKEHAVELKNVLAKSLKQYEEDSKAKEKKA